MKSPFPGMDPYLERHWRDIHHRFLTYACDALQEHLPGDLRARLEERVVVEPEFSELSGVGSDVRCAESEQASKGYIEIIDEAGGRRVVTVIELLSHVDKQPGKGQDEYVKRQREWLEGGVNLVEIDLLRFGERALALPPRMTLEFLRTTYQICVTRGSRPDRHAIYRATLATPLPVVQVPLRPTDADVPLDLQALIGRCYHHGRYDDLDYQAEPTPPFNPAEARWTDHCLTACGLRPGSPHPPGAAESKS